MLIEPGREWKLVEGALKPMKASFQSTLFPIKKSRKHECGSKLS